MLSKTTTDRTIDSADSTLTSVNIGEHDAHLSIKEWVWLGITIAGLLIVFLSPLREHLTHVQELNADIRNFGHFGPLIFILMTAVLTAIGFPRMLMYPLGGMAFGFSWGMTWSLLGALLGAYLTFCYARWAGSGYVLKRWRGLSKINDVVKDKGILTIALLRQLPGPGFLTNLFLGLSSVSHWAFIFGTAIGSLPAAVPATLIGSSIIQPTSHSRMWYIGAAVICMILLWLAFGLYFKICHSSKHR